MSRVLVVDDEADIRSFIRDALEGEGHEVSEAGDGAQAQTMLTNEAFHVLITDLKMPRMGGMELVRWLKSEQPEVEALVLTAHGTVDTALEAMRLGAVDYLQKPLRSLQELRLLVERAAERRRLRDQAAATTGTEGPPLSYGSFAMKEAERALEKVAKTDATVLLLGESGVGKEVAARMVHRRGPRATGPFVAVNCAALSEQLVESELFGHEKGAFTGAEARRRGRIEIAAGGTIFLDEVGELSERVQAKLLRVLQERSFERVGGTQTLKAEVRWIAATNRDLAKMVQEGSFREDLYHRLAVFPVRLPPLRERMEDIDALADQLLTKAAVGVGKPGLALSESARSELKARSWSGNIRELANALERAAILADGDVVELEDLQTPGIDGPSVALPATTLAELERQAIKAALNRVGGNRKKAAEALGIGERTLYDKIKRYGLT